MRHGPGAGLHQQPVGVAVVATGELDDFVPSGMGTGKPDSAHAGFRAGVDQTDHVDRRHGSADKTGQVHLLGHRRAETCASFRGFYQSIHHRWMGVAQHQGSPRPQIVDVFVAVGIPDVGTAAPGDEGRRTALWRRVGA